jgi:hypothetical protein
VTVDDPDAVLRERLRALDNAVPVPAVTLPAIGRGSTRRIETRLTVPVPALVLALAVVGLAGAFGSGLIGRTAPSTSLSSPAPTSQVAATVPAAGTLPPGGITRAAAENLAKEHVPAGAVVVDAAAGPFAEVYTPPGNSRPGPDYPVKPTDIVWAVTFEQDIEICPPDGSSCSPPRPATTRVFLDYLTGEFKASSTYAPAP